MWRSRFESRRGGLRMRISFLLCAIALAGALELSAQEGGYEYQDRGVVQQTVEDVMARAEFERLRGAEDALSKNPTWLDRILDWIEQWLAGGNARQTPDAPSGVAYFVYGIAFLIVAAALAFILKSVLESAQERELSVEREQARLVRSGAAPGETPPEEFWVRAQELAARGNEKLAIRELLFGAMSSLERQGFIRHRRGLTNRDYIWAASGVMRESVRTIVTVFEHVFFGRRAATADRFRECCDAYQDSFAVSDVNARGSASA